ncbi:MAG: hypothetical protein SWX82_33160 [Cyanobacteriota bacterium]|nr:hypothetical protein [Cyanobacteriota bacterium]
MFFDFSAQLLPKILTYSPTPLLPYSPTPTLPYSLTRKLGLKPPL